MAKLVLDVATLRGAVSLLRGESRTDEGRLVDLDIAALGTMLDAICFYDEALVPDLGHHLGAQLTSEVGEAVSHVPLAHEQRDRFVTESLPWLHRHCDLDSLATLLGVRPSYGDVLWGSNTWMLLQAVGVESKYESVVAQAMRSESDRAASRGESVQPHEIAKPLQEYGRRDGSGGVGVRLDEIVAEMVGARRFEDGWSYSHHWLIAPELELFATNLAWSLLRTRCYLLWAHEAGVPYMPHPLRARMAGYAAAVLDSPEFFHHRNREAFVQLYLECLASVHREGQEVVSEIAGTKLFEFPFPTILPYIVKRAGTRERILDVAYSMREGRGARSLRRRVTEFEEYAASGDLSATIRLRDELEQVSVRLREDLGLSRRAPIATTFSVGLPGVSFQFPGYRAPITVGRGPADQIRRPWLVFLRDVFDALTSASSLGSLYDVLYPPLSET